ncbi:MAG: hypothetical protein OWS74_02325 [Firmicutes bacterium]|nr:hypothetical protein [Bacillota bacterium]
MKIWRKTVALFALAGVLGGCSWSAGGPSAEQHSQGQSSSQSETQMSADRPTPALQKAVMSALETPKMQKMIADSWTSQQWQQALMTPAGQTALQKAVEQVMASPAMQKNLEADVQKALTSSTVQQTLDSSVRTSLLKMAIHGSSSKSGGSSSSSSPSG